MSKSKKNTIDPEEIITNYGADAVRLFILSDSPPEKDVQWSEQGMLGSYKFINKFWLVHQKIKNEIFYSNKDEKNKEKSIEENLYKFTNETIDKVTKNLESFHYNVIVANLHEAYNFLSKLEINKINKSILIENYVKILTIMSPVIPHLASECVDQIQKKESKDWPIVDKKILEKKTLEIVVQLNGKKRGIEMCDVNIEEKELLKLIKLNDKYKKYFKDKTIKKTIYVKDRLINLILK